jgi:hypothetical protein
MLMSAPSHTERLLEAVERREGALCREDSWDEPTQPPDEDVPEGFIGGAGI